MLISTAGRTSSAIRCWTLGPSNSSCICSRKPRTIGCQKEIIEEELAVRLTTEDVEKVFNTIVGWGRMAEIFGYDASSQELFIDNEPSTSSDENVRPVQ